MTAIEATPPVPNPVRAILRRALLGAPLVSPALERAGLAAVPIVVDGDVDADLLAEALSAGTTSLSEVSEAGAVDRVLLRHEGARPLLLLHGEEIVGAKQNRMLNASFLAPARGVVELPVSCVEAGRWGAARRPFEASDTTATSSLRGRSLRRVTRSVTTRESYDAGQSETWRDVDDYLTRSRTTSRTSSHREGVASRLAEAREVLSEIELSNDWAGMAFVRGDRLVGLDVFGSPGLFRRAFSTVALGVLTDVFALDVRDDRPTAVVEAALSAIRSAPLQSQRSVGLGETFHGGDSIVVGAVAAGGLLYHLFAAQPS
jgi:hypothetical protein